MLDVGGWARPFARADWVIDLQSYRGRGKFGQLGVGPERFDEGSWVEWGICAREPWPFTDNQFDFVYCGHTIEDVRDPLWVCREMVRVGRRGYIESPSPAVELTRGVESIYWVGHSHHRWIVQPTSAGLEFLAKPHFVNHPFRFHIPSLGDLSSDVGLLTRFEWEDTFECREDIHFSMGSVHARIEEIIAAATGGKIPSRVKMVASWLPRAVRIAMR